MGQYCTGVSHLVKWLFFRFRNRKQCGSTVPKSEPFSTGKPSGNNPQGENQQLKPELGVHRVALLSLQEKSQTLRTFSDAYSPQP
jgi:hypothetical protein